MREPFRIDPQLPSGAMKTYAILAPPSTHFRPATCVQAACQAHEKGWRTAVDEATELGRRQAHYIRRESGRSFTEHRNLAGLTVFSFSAGQTCFRPHQTRLDREEIFLVRDGDWRGNPRGTESRRHARPDDWVDDFANHQQKLADEIQKG